MRRIKIIATLLTLVLAFGACGGSSDDSFTEANLSKQLVDAGLLEKDVADCVADSVFTDLSDDQIKDMGDADFEGGGDLPPELETALTAAIQTCVAGAGDGTIDDGGTDGS